MLYEYHCKDCGKKHEAFRKVADRNRAPRCCGKGATRIISPRFQIMPVFSAYRAAGADRGKIIRTRQEHQDYLRQHGYEEVGNDPAFAPPPANPDEDARKERETSEALGQLKHAPELRHDATGDAI